MHKWSIRSTLYNTDQYNNHCRGYQKSLFHSNYGTSDAFQLRHARLVRLKVRGANKNNITTPGYR